MFSKAQQPQQTPSVKATTSFFKPEPMFKPLAPELNMQMPVEVVQRKPNAPKSTKYSAPVLPDDMPVKEAGLAEALEAMKSEQVVSPIRLKLLELFKAYNNAVIGDVQFTGGKDETTGITFPTIQATKQWNKTKTAEVNASGEYATRKAQYDADLIAFTKGELATKPIRPTPVPIMTTCIAVQTTILKKAFEDLGSEIKETLVWSQKLDKQGKFKASTGSDGQVKRRTQFDFGTLGRFHAEDIDAWHTARRGMGDDERPKSGDIFVLSKLGEGIKIAKGNLSYTITQRDKTIKELQDKLAKFQENDPAKIKAEAELVKTGERFQKSIETFEQKVETKREYIDEHAERLEFSHVGFFVKLEKEEINGNATGNEKWLTFDGGQSLSAKGTDAITGKGKQGSSLNMRTYNPKSNEISGEASQSLDARWLQGWVDVTKLTK
jgi:hypothetical protein